MVEFKGKFDEQANKSFEKRAFKTSSIIILIFSAVLILLGVVGLIWGEDKEDFAYALYCVSFGVVFYPLFVLIYFLIKKFVKQNNAIVSSQTEQQFQFFEDRFMCSQMKGEEFNDFLQAKYSILLKVVETKEQFFLYISPTQAYVVNKADLTSGTLEELNKIFSSNLGVKFKKLKRRQN